MIREQVSEVEKVVGRALRGVYTPVLHWSLGHRKTMVGIGAGFLAVVGLLIPRLGTEVLPALEEGNLWIRGTMPPTISLEAAMPAGNKMRELLLRHAEAITAVTQHGRPGNEHHA